MYILEYFDNYFIILFCNQTRVRKLVQDVYIVNLVTALRLKIKMVKTNSGEGMGIRDFCCNP